MIEDVAVAGGGSISPYPLIHCFYKPQCIYTCAISTNPKQQPGIHRHVWWRPHPTPKLLQTAMEAKTVSSSSSMLDL